MAEIVMSKLPGLKVEGRVLAWVGEGLVRGWYRYNHHFNDIVKQGAENVMVIIPHTMPLTITCDY